MANHLPQITDAPTTLRTALTMVAKNFKWTTALRVATDVLNKLPAQGDSGLQKIVKLLAIVDSVERIAVPKSQGELWEFLESRKLVETTNRSFVDLFFQTPLHKDFTILRIALSEKFTVVVATHHDFGTLYFVEYNYDTPWIDPSFWHGQDFPFDHVLARMWELFHHQIHIDLRYDASKARMRASYTPIPPHTEPFLGSAPNTLRALSKAHSVFQRDQVSRTYLFVGPPGCGKSTLALQFGHLAQGSILRIESSALTQTSTADLDFLLINLRPTFLIIDDIDRAENLQTSLPTLFSTLDTFRGKHPTVTIILTANSLEPFDSALLRPGRVSTLLEFKPPDMQERLEILSGYLLHLGISTTPTNLTELALATEGFTGDYLREFALQLRYGTLNDVLRLVATYKTLLAKTKKTDTKPNGAKPVSSNELAPTSV